MKLVFSNQAAVALTRKPLGTARREAGRGVSSGPARRRPQHSKATGRTTPRSSVPVKVKARNLVAHSARHAGGVGLRLSNSSRLRLQEAATWRVGDTELCVLVKLGGLGHRPLLPRVLLLSPTAGGSDLRILFNSARTRRKGEPIVEGQAHSTTCPVSHLPRHGTPAAETEKKPSAQALRLKASHSKVCMLVSWKAMTTGSFHWA